MCNLSPSEMQRIANSVGSRGGWLMVSNPHCLVNAMELRVTGDIEVVLTPRKDTAYNRNIAATVAHMLVCAIPQIMIQEPGTTIFLPRDPTIVAAHLPSKNKVILVQFPEVSYSP
jgi:hypothetical protein